MLNLLVIWSQEITTLVKFYNLLGVQLQQEQHGKGPIHYAAQLSETNVFEIYPATSAEKVTRNIRLGFQVEQLDIVLNTLIEAGFVVHQPAKKSTWGYRAVILDPEGRKIELVEQSMS
ncbi:hypothetical protein BKI52_21540 [marine bacterium AO1-C]|nr:hypothetical protein BKI52_21540 [marine bacterium AO1-C]